MNEQYLVAAYLVFWVVTMLYLWSIDRRQKQVKRQLDQMISGNASSKPNS